jgi:hypothetical protein
MTERSGPGILLSIRFKSSLDPDELKKRYRERMPAFRALPGLLQKYYVHDPSTEEWGGIYLWDSQTSLDEYLASDLRKSIPETYGIVGAPRVERLGVIELLRPDIA